MVVQVRIAHRRAVDDQALFEKVLVAFLDGLQLLQKIRDHADVVRVQLLKQPHLVPVFLVVRARMKSLIYPAVRVQPARRVARELERHDPREVGLKGGHDQVHHQVHVLAERVRDADRRLRQRARFAALVVRLDVVKPAFDFPHRLQIAVEPLPIARTELTLHAGNLARQPIEDARGLLPSSPPILRRAAATEQLVEDRARVANRRQRFGRRRP